MAPLPLGDLQLPFANNAVLHRHQMERCAGAEVSGPRPSGNDGDGDSRRPAARVDEAGREFQLSPEWA